MDVTVNINAPAIVDAINRLSEVLGSALLSAGVQAQTQTTIDTATTTPPTQQIAVQDVTATAVQPVQQVMDAHVPPFDTAPQTVQQMPQQTAQPTANTAPVQQTAPAVDEAYRNRVCTAAARLVEQGMMGEVLGILQSFGVPSVVHLSATQLPEFANRITALGAVI